MNIKPGLIIFSMIFSTMAFANTKDNRSYAPLDSSSNSYLYISTGFYEAACIGFGKDFDENWGIFEASVGSIFATAYHPDHNICNEFQLNVSSEKENRHGLHFYYSAGLGYSSEKNSGGMFTPLIKLGTVFNF